MKMTESQVRHVVKNVLLESAPAGFDDGKYEVAMRVILTRAFRSLDLDGPIEFFFNAMRVSGDLDFAADVFQNDYTGIVPKIESSAIVGGISGLMKAMGKRGADLINSRAGDLLVEPITFSTDDRMITMRTFYAPVGEMTYREIAYAIVGAWRSAIPEDPYGDAISTLEALDNPEGRRKLYALACEKMARDVAKRLCDDVKRLLHFLLVKRVVDENRSTSDPGLDEEEIQILAKMIDSAISPVLSPGYYETAGMIRVYLRGMHT